jgi:hypothetical protein
MGEGEGGGEQEKLSGFKVINYEEIVDPERERQ